MNQLYRNFDVAISRGENNCIEVAVECQAGQRHVSIASPFEETSFRKSLERLELLVFRRQTELRKIPSDVEQAAMDFGGALFDTLFHADIRGLYYDSRSKAQAENRGLRLRLQISAPELTALPWEFLYDGNLGRFLCLSKDTSIVRSIDQARPVAITEVTPPLRILGMTAEPNNLPRLNTDEERSRLEHATESLRKDRLLELVWVDGSQWSDLQRTLLQGSWHVFHFIGHARFDALKDEGVIFLCDSGNGAQLIPASKLGYLLTDHETMRLAVLNACESARGGNRDVYSSTGSILTRMGLPAVVAMQDEVSERTAITLAHSFYESLASGQLVDVAVSQARLAVMGTSDSCEWGIPVLYGRALDDNLLGQSSSTTMAGLASGRLLMGLNSAVTQLRTWRVSQDTNTIKQSESSQATTKPETKSASSPFWLLVAVAIIALAIGYFLAPKQLTGILEPIAQYDFEKSKPVGFYMIGATDGLDLSQAGEGFSSGSFGNQQALQITFADSTDMAGEFVAGFGLPIPSTRVEAVGIQALIPQNGPSSSTVVQVQFFARDVSGIESYSALSQIILGQWTPLFWGLRDQEFAKNGIAVLELHAVIPEGLQGRMLFDNLVFYDIASAVEVTATPRKSDGQAVQTPGF